jgi:hypothetical protein
MECPDKSFRSHQKAPVFIGRALSVVNVTGRLLDQVSVSLEYVAVAATKADFGGQIAQCSVAHSTGHWTVRLERVQLSAACKDKRYQ